MKATHTYIPETGPDPLAEVSIGQGDLAQRRREHLDRLTKCDKDEADARAACLHLSCPACFGTGRKADGTMCVHSISCPCPRCTPRC